MNNKAVIMAGGNGTRLWPFSTPERPKFLLPLKTSKPLIEDIYNELVDVFGVDNVYICTRKDKVSMIKNSVNTIPEKMFIEEPEEFTGTFKTCEFCIKTLSKDCESNILFCGADALFYNTDIIKESIKNAIKIINEGRNTIIFGHIPDSPNTNFGYVKTYLQNNCIEFHEKPNLKTSENLIKEGGWYWNMGMTFINSTVFKDSVEQIKKTFCTNLSDGISIDKAYLERHYFHTSPLKLVKINKLCWKDIGLLENLKDDIINKDFIRVLKNKKDITIVLENHKDGYDLKDIVGDLTRAESGQTIYISKFGKKIV